MENGEARPFSKRWSLAAVKIQQPAAKMNRGGA
jgi:hypothetical protein